MDAELTHDILKSRKIRKIDIFEFMAFIEASEPSITLTQFADILWDEVTDNYTLDFTKDAVALHTYIIHKDIELK